MASVGPTDTIQGTTYRFVPRREWKEKEKWVTENIKMRKCSYFIASTERKSEGMCQCGYRKEDHDDDAINRSKQEQSQQDLKWNFEQHTDTVPTNAFGEIEFVGFNGKNAKFVRVDSKTNIDKLLMLMENVWKIKLPTLIISVIGGEENFNMTPHLRDMFQSSLVNLARDKDAWIITGGTNNGVAKHVGEAVKYSRVNSGNKKNIVAIGIAPWGVIHKKQLLVDKKQFEPIQYKIEDKPIEHEKILNPYHSHYILVDNGTQHQFETETALRAKLELMCNTTQNGVFRSIPVVLLVVDGGPHILKRVRNALSNSIPVLIVKGSGGVADLLAFAVTDAEVSESSDKDDKGKTIRKTTKRLTNSQRRFIYNKMRSTKVCETNDNDYNINEIEACLDMFDLISIFELGSGDQDLNKTIVPAMIKVWKRTADMGCKTGRLDDIMMSAIQSNKVDFVELLLDNGVNIETCLTSKRLLELYNGELPSNSPFTHLLRNMRKKNKKMSTKTISMKEVGQVIKHLLDEYYLQQYSSNPGTDLADDAPFENPFLHLLIWAVLNNMQDMAKLFWRKGKDSIAAALLARALFSAMPSKLKDASPILYEGVKANSREFKDLATAVLDRCYKTHEDYTVLLLIQDLDQWEASNCISLAIKTNNKTFITAQACQKVFNTMWMGQMTQENGLLKLLICTFIPPLIPLCVQFKKKLKKPDPGDKMDEDGQSSVETEMPQSGSSPQDSEDEKKGNHENSHVLLSDEGEQPIIEGTSKQEIVVEVPREVGACSLEPCPSASEELLEEFQRREKENITSTKGASLSDMDEDGQSSVETKMPQSGSSPQDSEDEKKGNHEDSRVLISDEEEQPINEGTSTQEIVVEVPGQVGLFDFDAMFLQFKESFKERKRREKENITPAEGASYSEHVAIPQRSWMPPIQCTYDVFSPMIEDYTTAEKNKPSYGVCDVPVLSMEEAGVSSPLLPSQLKHGDEIMKYFGRAKGKIRLFYGAPVVHFLSHVISYMAFLCLYSYVLISKFYQNVSVEDVILIVWVFTIFINEICQVIATRRTYTEIKLKAYLADFWNIADILMILLFVVGMILKHLSYQETLEAARVVLGINLIIYFLRLLQMFSLNKELGPKLVMIIRMVRNLTSFFVILLIFIVAYAIASHAILYPNTEITFNVLRIIFRRPYWNIYGDLMLDEIEGTNDCTNIVELYRNGTQPRCPTESGKYVVPVLMGVYMLMCNILLLNLLISIFSNTYEKVEKKADKHWRVQSYRQMQDYLARRMHVPFISFIGDIEQILVFFKECLCRCKPEKRTNVFLKDFPEYLRDILREWERGIAQKCINSKQADLESTDKSVTKITQRLDQVVSKIDALEKQQHVLTATMENDTYQKLDQLVSKIAGTSIIEDARFYRSQTKYPTKSESSTVDKPGLVTSDQRMDNMEKKLQWIVDRLKEHQPGAEQASPEKN